MLFPCCFAALLGLATLAAADMKPEYLKERDRRAVDSGIIYDGNIASSYDYVIIGGGLAGLVLASRLSEDANTTVLVLEAGDTGDAVRSSIDVPGNAYYSSLLGTSYDWQYETISQPMVNNRSLAWPRGRVLGGSTAVNGLYLVRPSAIEFNVWAQLQNNAEGADQWGWDSMFSAMKKSENFTAPLQAVAEAGAIEYNINSHGTTGPVHTSYPGFILPIVGNWTATLDWIGILPSDDPAGGDSWGAFITTSSINPDNYTRSYSRSAYIDPLPPRSNLAILPNATVTRLILETGSDGAVTATAVEYSPYRYGPIHQVGVNREALVCGGAVASPAILMHSGLGPTSVLQPLGISTYVNLPGVGQAVQDHLSGQVVFSTSAETAAALHGSTAPGANGSTAFLSFINSAIAYPNITDLLGDYAPTFQSDILANLTWAAETLVPSTDPTVIAGYKAVYQAVANNILPTQVGQVELLFGLTGTSYGADTISIQAALQHPYSRGQIYINSTDAFSPPVIDPRYLTHPADIVMLREGLKLARTLGETQPLNASITGEVSPGPVVATDAEWDAWLPSIVGTEYHPSCSCAMLPLSEGGVVDPTLKVYGTTNIRVIDSSVFPMEFAAHLMVPTYGLAEQAAEMLRAQYNTGVTPPNGTQSASQPSATASSPAKSGASSTAALAPAFLALLTAACAFILGA